MTSGANGEWVRQGTPHDDNADWDKDQSEYGTAISPTEWDDYSSEQSVPVVHPRENSDDGAATAGSPASPPAQDAAPVPGQEPDAGEQYRSEEIDPLTVDQPAGDADQHGMEPARTEDPRPAGDTLSSDESHIVGDDEPFSAEPHEETTRPRPIVPDVAADPDADSRTDLKPDVDHDEAETAEHHRLEAAEYLAVDPVPMDEVNSEPTSEDVTDDEPTQHVDVDDDEPTQHVDVDDMEDTQAVPVTVVAAAGGATAAPATSPGAVVDGLYRANGTEETTVIAEDQYPNADADVEEERRQAQLDAERQAREHRLGAVPTSTDNARREDIGAPRVTTDRFFPSFGLFVLRIVVAGVLGLASYQILGSGVDGTANFLAGYPMIPEPRLVAWILGFTLGAMALLLVIGLLQRVIGFLLLAISVALLVFIRWGNFQIFTSGGLWIDGFIGDKDLILAAVGLVLLSIGGGAWGIDGAFRRARAASRAEKQG